MKPLATLLVHAVGMLVLLGAVGTTAHGATVEFYLVPQHRLSEPNIAEYLLFDGQVLLFREGAFEPEIIAPVLTPVTIPSGNWSWLATAPGYVSVITETLHLPDSPASREYSPRALLPVVEACEISLAGAPSAWRGIQRVDFVSIEYGSVYPSNPRNSRAIRVPAGSFMAYTIAVRGLDALAGPLPCRAGMTEEFGVPEPPPPGRHSFMVHTRFPQGLGPEIGPISAVLEPAAEGWRETSLLRIANGAQGRHADREFRKGVAIATAHTRSGNRESLFFVDVPAVEAQRLVLSHPKLRTLQIIVPRQDRAVRDLGLQQLKTRRSVTFGVDYRPLRRHKTERILLFDCGRQPQTDCDLWPPNCEPLSREIPLQAGIASYQIQDLDDGQLMVMAEIDAEWVPHLGNQYCPYLDPENDEPAEDPGVLPLREMHIYGSILLAGEPVAGQVRLEEGPGRPARTFATDERLEYHLYYFGQVPGRTDFDKLFPDSNPDRIAELYGLYSRPHLRVCSLDGACRSFHVFSTLVGEGRLDFDLGSPSVLEVCVRSIGDGRPVGSAHVGISIRPSEIHFVNGEVREERLGGMEGIGTWTPPNGRVRFRNLPVNEDFFIYVKKPGFEDYTRRIRIDPTEEEATVDAWIQRDQASGFVLQFRDGSAAANAFLLPVRGEERDWRCGVTTNSLGRFEVEEACRNADWYILIHPQATITFFEPGELFNVGNTIVGRAPAPPPTVRVVDGEGLGQANIVIGLRFRNLLLTPTDVSGAATLSLQEPLFFRTDSKGVAQLWGVDLNGVDVPDLGLYLADKPVFKSLAGFSQGEVIEVVIP